MDTIERVTDAVNKAEDAAKDIKREELLQKFSHAHHKLSKPFTYCGETYEELDMDFESLTGRMIESIDDELAAMNININTPSASHRYQRMVAARAAKVPSDMIEALPLSDYNAITNAARFFLIVTG